MNAILRTYRTFLIKTFKYTSLTLLGLMGGFVLCQFVVLPVAKKQLVSGKVQTRRTLDGEPISVYQAQATPQTYSQQMDADSTQLIYQHQQRFYDKKAATESSGEDESPDLVTIPDPERQALRPVVQNFIAQWETFSVGESDKDYQRGLLPLADPDQLDSLAAREDNSQNADISRSGSSGSQLEGGINPGDNMVVLDFDGKTAYVSAVASVRYIGPSLTFKDMLVRRSYGIVLRKGETGWKVSRCAAETLGQIS